jgi:rod shape-determining protein MreD
MMGGWPSDSEAQLRFWGFTVATAIACLLLLWVPFPGLQLLGYRPDWMIVWLLFWCLGRPPWMGAIAGANVGLLLDSITTADGASHFLSCAVVGALVGFWSRRMQAPPRTITLLLWLFALVLLADSLYALQQLIPSHAAGWPDWQPETMQSRRAIVYSLNQDLTPRQGIDPQMVGHPPLTFQEMLHRYMLVGLSSAIVTSLCAPLLLWPLQYLWQQVSGRYGWGFDDSQHS